MPAAGPTGVLEKVLKTFLLFLVDFGSPSALSAPVVPLRSSAWSLSARPKDRLLNARKAGLGSAETPHKTAGRTVQDAFRAAGRRRVLRDAGNPDKLSKMLQMISALKEAQRTLNSTLSSHITFMPNGTAARRFSADVPVMVVILKAP